MSPEAAAEDLPETDETDDATPTRRCILSGAHGDRSAFIRLVRGADGAIHPDLAAKAPGRGAWIAPDRAALAKGLTNGRLKGQLARAFRTGDIGLGADLPAAIEIGLARRALDRLGLEQRAGHLIWGHERIADAIAAGRVHGLIHAGDAAEDGARKLASALARQHASAYSLALPTARGVLSLALGRENVVHLAATDSKAAGRIWRDVTRWIAYCNLPAGNEPLRRTGRQPADESM